MNARPQLHTCEIPQNEPEFYWDEIERDDIRHYNAVVEMVNEDGPDTLSNEDLDLIAFNSGSNGFIPFGDFRQILPRFLTSLSRKRIGFREDFLFARFIEYFEDWTESEKSTITNALITYAGRVWHYHIVWNEICVPTQSCAEFIAVCARWFEDLQPFFATWQNEKMFIQTIKEFKQSELLPDKFFKSASSNPVAYNTLLRFLLGEKAGESDIAAALVRRPPTSEKLLKLDAENKTLEARLREVRLTWEKPPEDPISGPEAREKGEQFEKEMLKWFASTQTDEGTWEDRGSGVLVPTALVLLAFMGAGNTHRVGTYKECVRKALHRLAEKAGLDGSFGATHILPNVCATWALSEAYAVTRDYRIFVPYLRAVADVISKQIPAAGWPEKVGEQTSNFTVTAFATLALKAAKTAGLALPESSFDDAVSFFDSVTDESGRVGEDRENPERLPLHTAMAAVCRIFCGVPRRTASVINAANIILSKLDLAKVEIMHPSVAAYYYFATYT
jgi:hypothetical protein